MNILPLYRWTTQNGQSGYFPDFRLIAERSVLRAVQPQREALPVRSESAQELRLLRCEHLKNEAYCLKIEEAAITLTALSDSGFYYGLAALKILLAVCNSHLPQGTIEEAPAYPNRGLMLDVSRGKMPTLAYLKQLVSVLSDLRYNILQLYCEDKLALEGHPLLGALTGAYTESEIRELDAYCKAHYVELQPCIQTYSHMHGLLRTPGYSHLAENNDLFSFAAGNQAVYDFLEDEFRQVLPWFSSKTLNINMDEAYDIGTGFSKQAVEERGRGAVFLAHILRVIDAARRSGAGKIQLWGDILQKYPELISELPEDTVVMEWNYNPLEKFESLELFRTAGREFWAAGGVSSWNSLFPRVYNSYINLTNLSTQAWETGANGFLLTDWGDYGHMQPLGLSLYGYLIGGLQAAWPKLRTGAELENALWPLFMADGQMQEGFRALMDSNLAYHLKTDFKTMSVYYFFDDMLDGLSMRGNEKYEKLTEETFWQLLACGERACRLLEDAKTAESISGFCYPDENWQALFGERYLQELQLSARMTRFIGQKGLLACRIRGDLARENLSGDDLMEMIFQIHRLYDEFCWIRRQFEDVWLLRAKHKGIQTSLSLFDHAGAQMAQTVRWLALQREAVLRGERADWRLESYAGAQYEVLWTADFRNMWDRAYPWR